MRDNYTLELARKAFELAKKAYEKQAGVGISWEEVKQKLIEEGALNKKYDVDLDGKIEMVAEHIHTASEIEQGHNSGLDADKLDGHHAFDFVRKERKINTGYGLTGGGDLSADRTIEVVDGSSVQKIEVAKNNSVAGVRKRLNFIEGNNISLNISDDGVNNKVDVSVSAVVEGHKLLGDKHIDTDNVNVQNGMLIVGRNVGGSVKWSGLSIGSEGNVLKSENNNVVWSRVRWNEVLDKPSAYPPVSHTHDASELVSGRISLGRLPTSGSANRFLVVRTANGDALWDVIGVNDIPTLSRSKIEDFWSSPFWNNIPDKPNVYPPDTHTHGASDIVSGRLSLSRLPTSSNANRVLVVRSANSDPVYDVLTVDDIPTLSRSKISDFWNTPFWNNIPDKPSTYPPSSHTHSASDITPQGHNSGLNADMIDGVHLSSLVQTSRQINTGTGLSGGGDLSADRTLSVVNDTTVQRVEVARAGTLVGTRKRINFVEGSGVSINVADDNANNKVDITITANGGGGTHNLLNGSVHPDTDTVSVARGMIIAGRNIGGNIRWSGVSLGSSGTVLKSDGTDVVWGNVQWGEIGGRPSIFPAFAVWFVLNPINTSTWYIPYVTNQTALATLALTANRIYYIPFVPFIDCTITALAVEVTVASAGTGQVGVYDTSNFRPANRLGFISIDTGTTGVKSGTVSIPVQAGRLYWLALINTSAATLRAVAVGGLSPILGIATGGTAFNSHYFEAGSGGTLPTTANANNNGTGTVPAIYIRYS